MLKYLPNILTLSRIVVIPFVLIAMLFDSSPLGHRLAATLFLCACLTDFFDGFLARKFSVQSELGTWLDPVADKLLVGAIIVILVYHKRADLFPAVAIISREIMVSGLRELLAKLKTAIPVSDLAKVKTFTQMASLFLLILGDQGSALPYTLPVGRVSLWIATILTLITGYAYLKAGVKYFVHSKHR